MLSKVHLFPFCHLKAPFVPFLQNKSPLFYDYTTLGRKMRITTLAVILVCLACQSCFVRTNYIGVFEVADDRFPTKAISAISWMEARLQNVSMTDEEAKTRFRDDIKRFREEMACDVISRLEIREETFCLSYVFVKAGKIVSRRDVLQGSYTLRKEVISLIPSAGTKGSISLYCGPDIAVIKDNDTLVFGDFFMKRQKPNSESCVTRSGHTTPVEQAPVSREATPGQPGN